MLRGQGSISKRGLLAAAAFLGAALLLPQPAEAQFSQVSAAALVNRPASNDIRAASEHPSACANADAVVFESGIDDLVGNDTNGARDVFLSADGTLSGVNLSTAGALSAAGAGSPSVSAKSTSGEFAVAFVSMSADIVPGYAPPSMSQNTQVYLRVFPSGKTVLISRAASGAAQGAIGSATQPVVSIIPGVPTRYKVAFLSTARNMAPGGSAVGTVWPYLATVEMKGGSPVVTSVATLPIEPNDNIADVALSGDGNSVAFSTAATNLAGGNVTTGGRQHVYLWTVPPVAPPSGSEIEMISRSASGDPGLGTSLRPSLSFQGDVQTFITRAANILPDANSDRPAVALRRSGSSTTTQANATADGQPSGGFVTDQQISPSGIYVVFSDTGNVVGTPTNFSQAYIKNVLTGEVALVSRLADGSPANGDCGEVSVGAAAFNAAKTFVSFSSVAQNLTDVALNDNPAIFRTSVVSAPPPLSDQLPLNAPPDIKVKERNIVLLLQGFKASGAAPSGALTQATRIRYRTVVQKTTGRRERILRITTRNQVTIRRLSPGRYTVRYRVTGTTSSGNISTRFSPKQPFKIV